MKGDYGFGLAFEVRFRTLTITEFVNVQATDDNKVMEKKGTDWKIEKSTVKLDGSLVEVTISTEKGGKEIGLAEEESLQMKCYASKITSTEVTYGSEVKLRDWTSGEAVSVNTAHLDMSHYLQSVWLMVMSVLVLFNIL